MDADKKFEGWCRGLIAKYPDEVIALLAALCRSGLSRGECSANDINGSCRVSDPHVVGAAFKLCKRIGFARSDRIVARSKASSHSSFVLVWELVDRHRAEMFLAECRHLLGLQETKPEAQRLLAL